MPRPSLAHERRAELRPVIARAFAEAGYRRMTTAELARRCGLQETQLFRLWPDKRAMFLAAIDYVYAVAVEQWQTLLRASEVDDGGDDAAQRLLAYEAKHHGEWGLYRIVFAGLSESDDPEVRRALRRMYARFHRFIARQITAHRAANEGATHTPDPELAAWAIIGMGTVADVLRELRVGSAAQRRELFEQVGQVMLEGQRTR
ncbi:MAG: TetR/AcrR family transcriptional regulator [Phycisphaeraceae bacterium]